VEPDQSGAKPEKQIVQKSNEGLETQQVAVNSPIKEDKLDPPAQTLEVRNYTSKDIF